MSTVQSGVGQPAYSLDSQQRQTLLARQQELQQQHNRAFSQQAMMYGAGSGSQHFLHQPTSSAVSNPSVYPPANSQHNASVAFMQQFQNQNQPRRPDFPPQDVLGNARQLSAMMPNVSSNGAPGAPFTSINGPSFRRSLPPNHPQSVTSQPGLPMQSQTPQLQQQQQQQHQHQQASHQQLQLQQQQQHQQQQHQHQQQQHQQQQHQQQQQQHQQHQQQPQLAGLPLNSQGGLPIQMRQPPPPPPPPQPRMPGPFPPESQSSGYPRAPVNGMVGPTPRAVSAQGPVLGGPPQSHHPMGVPHSQSMHPNQRTPFQPPVPLPSHPPSLSASPAHHSPHPMGTHSQAHTPANTSNTPAPTSQATRSHQATPENVFSGMPMPSAPSQAQQMPRNATAQNNSIFIPPEGTPTEFAQPMPLGSQGGSQTLTRHPNFLMTPSETLQQLQSGHESGSNAPSSTGTEGIIASSPSVPGLSQADSATNPVSSQTPRPISTIGVNQRQPLSQPGSFANVPPPRLSGPPMQPDQVLNTSPAVRPPIPGQLGTLGLGSAQGVLRLLQFSAGLALETPERSQLEHWRRFVAEYFTPTASMKITLWKDNQRVEAKPFDIGVQIISRFFLVTSQSGVKAMHLTLDGARERSNVGPKAQSIVECTAATWTFKYTNGYSVVLRGPLMACFTLATHPASTPTQPHGYSLRMEALQFEASFHEKHVLVDTLLGGRTSPHSPKSRNPISPTVMTQSDQTAEKKPMEDGQLVDKYMLPPEPVNAFGIPQATMRCLELAESVGQMGELFQFSADNGLGPLDALAKFAEKMREMPHAPFTNGFVESQMKLTGMPPSPAVTLHSANAPTPSATTASTITSAATSTAQPTPVANGDTSSSATAPPQPSTPALAPAVPAVSSPLKRKSGEGISPPASAEPASKRPQRRKSRNG